MKIHHCYLPCLQFISNLWHLILGEYRILTFLLLLAIVFQQEDGLAGKQDDGYEIAEGEKSIVISAKLHAKSRDTTAPTITIAATARR